jgi:hypothetical protein
MGTPFPGLYRPVTVEIPNYGKLIMAPQESSPLLMVFGGIAVSESAIDPTDKAHAGDMVQSGVYMWPYFNNLRNRFHVFVSNSPKVNGAIAYRYVLYTLKWKGFPPALCPVEEKPEFSGPYQVLYLFSGGYLPGMQLMKTYSSDLFSNIFLVDIWMKDNSVASYYKNLARANSAKTYYVHTGFGAVNDEARDAITKTLGSARAPLVKAKHGESGMETHLRTNAEAVTHIW